MKKRIALMVASLAQGGTERQIVKLAQILKNDYIVKVFYYYAENPFYKEELDKFGVENECISWSSKYSRIKNLKNAFKQFEADVVIAYMNEASMTACIIKMLGAKWNLICSERSTTQKLTSRERLKFFLYRWTTYISPNSKTQTEFIKKNYRHLSPKLYTIYNYIDTDCFTPINANHVYPDKGEHIDIIGVGRVVPVKNIINLVDALKIVKDKRYDVGLKWYGSKKTHYYDILSEHIRVTGMLDNVKFMDPTTQIQKEYAKADVFCLSSIYEGFPNVLCEAMACGLPILASRVCDNPYIANDGENGFLFCPTDPNDIADAILRFINLTSDEKKQMAQRSTTIINEKFPGKKIKEDYIKLIESNK